MRAVKRGWIVLLAMLLARVTGAEAQQTAAVSGRVVDAVSGVAVEGAAVRIAESASEVVRSGPDGRWSIAGIVAGNHLLRVERTGYTARTVSVRVPASAEARIALSPEALKLDALVVTASRRMQRLADVPVTTELITREELRQSGASDLTSALVEHTGVLDMPHPANPNADQLQVFLQGAGEALLGEGVEVAVG